MPANRVLEMPCLDNPGTLLESTGGLRMTDYSAAPKLDPREQHFRIPGPRDGLSLFLRFLDAVARSGRPRQAVLYVHGATFPSALSIAHRFDGRSWRDALIEAGFDVWGLDFHGFGHSDRYPEMSQPAENNQPLCVAEDAAKQVEAGVRFILAHQKVEKLSLVPHSWGSMPACIFAAAYPALIDRLVLFAPIARREPKHEPPVLSRGHFEEWSRFYLDSDQESRSRNPAGVKTPLRPVSEIIKTWHGRLAYDPAKIRAPVAIIRGEWDSLMRDDDARWLFDSFTGAPVKRDVKIGRGTHLMHFEAMRPALWRESINFLTGDDVAEPDLFSTAGQSRLERATL